MGRTVTLTAEVEFDPSEYLSDIDTKDLLEELKDRNEDVHERSTGIIKLNSIQDEIKFEAIKQKFYNIPEHELDEFLSKY